MNTNKVLGSTLISIGTSIGAGILALPLVGAAPGFLFSALLIIGLWLIITYSALLIVEINLSCPANSCSFDAMVQKTLGPLGRLITWVVVLCLHYALLAAYSSGATVLLSDLFTNVIGISIPNWISALLFVSILGGAVFWSTQAVDYTNRFFISIKGILLIAAVILLLPRIELTNIIGPSAIHNIKGLGIAAPIFLGAFGFLATIPSLRLYVGDKSKDLRVVVICGTTIPLIIYLLWLVVNLGIVPFAGEKNSFSAIQASGGSVAQLIDVIANIVKSKWATIALQGFSNVSMTTSFLGVALGLFDFLAEGFKRTNTSFGRLQTAALTFLPPLVFALFYPKGFIVALGYAAIFVAILEVIFPALMAWKLKQTLILSNGVSTKATSLLFNRFTLSGLVIAGITIIVLQIMSDLHLL